MINKVNPCYNNPCLNGGSCQATGSGNSYICICPAGYSGINCQTCKHFILNPKNKNPT